MRWRTDDGQHPIVVVAQLGRDLPFGARDATLSLDADGSWRCMGSERRDDARIGPCCLPCWVLTGQLDAGSSLVELVEATRAEVASWLVVGLRPVAAVDVPDELVDWHRPVTP